MEYLIKTKSIGGLTEEQFFQFCQENEDVNLERNSLGDILVMEPTGAETGWYNNNIATDLTLWNRKAGAGYIFDSNTGFTLPNGAVRSPDVSFISKPRWEKVHPEDRKRFAHICPDFIIELLSKSDQASVLRPKMEEWMQNGCRLAWMIDPHERRTTVYTPEGNKAIIPFAEPVCGDDVLPGFILDLKKMFSY